MSISQELLKLRPTILAELGLKIDLEFDDGASSCVDLSGRNVIIRFTRDKGAVTADVAHVSSPRHWLPFGTIARLLGKEHTQLSDVKLSYQPIMLSLLAGFLIPNYLSIEERFSPEHLPETRGRIGAIREEIMRERCGDRWPPAREP